MVGRDAARARVPGAAAVFEKHPGARAFQYFGYGGYYQLEKPNAPAAIAWAEGLARRLDEKGVAKAHKTAVTNARAYVERGDLTSEIAAGALWWSMPLPAPREEPAKRTHDSAGTLSEKNKKPRRGDAAKDTFDEREEVKDAGADEFEFPRMSKTFVGGERKEYTPTLSVLSLGKPPPFERIHRSVFVSRPPPVKLHKSETAVCDCHPPPSRGDSETIRDGCGQECLNRKLRFSCDSRTCPCGDACSNRPLSQLPAPKTKIIRTENRGWGLTLQEPVRAGTFIVEYAGEILDEHECAERLWYDKQSGEENFYLMEISANYVIDAKFKGSIARFINSSCHPNCETQRWVDASTNETRVGIFATEDIASGTELTYDYNFAHFGDEKGTSFVCMCGHPKCRGTLDAAKTSKKNLHRRLRVEIMVNGKVVKSRKKKQKVKATVVDYDAAKNRYKVQVEGDEKETFAWVRLDGEGAAKHSWLSK